MSFVKFRAFRGFKFCFLDKKKRAGRPRSLSPSPHRLLRLAVAVDAVLVAGEFAQAHGAAGVEFVGGDADFGAEDFVIVDCLRVNEPPHRRG
jgi:hypothetical protein